MTARKSIYTIIAAISVALVATVALVSIGNIGAQTAASRLADIPTPSCGGAGEADCSTGRIYAVSRLAGLTNSSGADELDLDYTGPSGVVDLTLEYVGDGNSLYATYANEANVILNDADTLVVVVEDADAIAARTVGYGLETVSTLSGNTMTSENQRVSILLRPGLPGATPRGYTRDLPILDADGDGDLRDDVILFLDADNDNVFDPGEEFEANNTAAYRIDQVDPGLNGAFATIDLTVFDIQMVSDLAVTWETADMDNRVVVEVDSSQRGAGSTFLSIAETSRGSGRFVGEIQLVDSAVEINQTNYDVYEDATSSAALSIDTTNIALPVTGTVRVVDGTQEVVPLPVDSRSSVTFRYLDKTGEDNSGRDQTTTRSTTVAIDADAPEITVDLPVNDSATSSRRPTFEGSVADAGGSGLDIESLRLAIDNTYNDIATANVDEASQPAIDIAGAISNLGYFVRPSDYDVAAVDNTAGSPSDPRVLVGSDDPTSGLYAADTDYPDGADAVDFEYTPSNAQRLLTDEELSSIDQQIDFQLFVYDVAGNVGFSDSDPEDDGATGVGIQDNFQPHVFSIDGSRPILADTDEGQRGPDFPITVYPMTDNSDVRLFDSTQTGLVWDNGDREFQIDSNFIMVVFNDRVVGATPNDFDVEFSTSGVADPSILRVVVPTNVSNDDFIRSTSTDAQGVVTTVYHPDVDEIVRILGNSLFIELSTPIPPADQPVVTVTGVSDSAGNSINTDANTEPANDGLGPEVSVTISDGTGVGSDADGTGPGTLTRNAITIEVTSNEAGVPQLEFYQLDANDMPVSRDTKDAREISDANGIFRYEYDFTPVRVNNIVDGDVCVVVSTADDAGNPATRGVMDCASNDAIGFTVDTDGPDLDTADFQTPAGGIATQTEYEQRPQVRIPFDEDVQADSVEVRIDGDDVPSSRISSSSASAFVYQPATDLDFDTYRIEVRATDLAGNEGSFDAFNLVIEERGDFIVGLSAGWNLISFPSDPINPAVNSVFSNDAVQTVSTFDAANFRNGDMQANRSAATGNFSGSLTSVRAGLAYWVFADNPTDLEVALLGPSSASNAARPGLTVIPTIPGVNLVGVVDTSRSNANTQGDIVGNPLTRRAADEMGVVTDQNVTIATYLGETDYSRVYEYDSTRRQFVLLNDGADIEIGTGLLVFINADSSGRTAPIVP